MELIVGRIKMWFMLSECDNCTAHISLAGTGTYPASIPKSKEQG